MWEAAPACLTEQPFLGDCNVLLKHYLAEIQILVSIITETKEILPRLRFGGRGEAGIIIPSLKI